LPLGKPDSDVIPIRSAVLPETRFDQLGHRRVKVGCFTESLKVTLGDHEVETVGVRPDQRIYVSAIRVTT
jgi:hypothetical protein